MKNNLKAKRLDAGLTQEDVARAVDLTVRYYQRLEAGGSIPTAGVAIAIARKLRSTVEELWMIGR